MAPVVHRLEAAYGDRINFIYLDIDDPAVKPFLQKLPLHVRPQYYLLDGEGNIVQEWQGTLPAYHFARAFDRVLREE